MSEVRISRTMNNNAKWEAFQPQKIEGKDRYTQTDIGKVFGISRNAVCLILNGNEKEKGYNETLAQKVRAFAKEVKYKEPRETKQKHISVYLSAHNYSSKQARYDHMLKLREDGYTNTQIARLTGYNRKTVFEIIGAQPESYTAMSHERAGKMRKIINEDRRALSVAIRQEKIDAANAQVEIYNSAVDELRRMCEAVVAQKSAVEKMRGTLSSCEKFATVPIREFTMLQN